jgi:hypothetical protein
MNSSYCKIKAQISSPPPFVSFAVLHARSCLCRLLQHPCRTEEDIERGMAGAAAAFKRTGSRNIQGRSRQSREKCQ